MVVEARTANAPPTFTVNTESGTQPPLGASRIDSKSPVSGCSDTACPTAFAGNPTARVRTRAHGWVGLPPDASLRDFVEAVLEHVDRPPAPRPGSPGPAGGRPAARA